MITIKYETVERGAIAWDELVKHGSYTLASVAREGVDRGFVSGANTLTRVLTVVPWHRVIEIREGGDASQD